MDFVDSTGLWVWGDGPAAPVPPPDEDVSHGPHKPVAWRSADPRLRRLLLRGVLPEEFLAVDANELQELFEILDDLDRMS